MALMQPIQALAWLLTATSRNPVEKLAASPAGMIEAPVPLLELAGVGRLVCVGDAAAPDRWVDGQIMRCLHPPPSVRVNDRNTGEYAHAVAPDRAAGCDARRTAAVSGAWRTAGASSGFA